jgi:hypothetical protein
MNANAPALEHRCLRCKTVKLAVIEPYLAEMTFFECPVCRRQYALQPGKELVFRWLHPISQALYRVIFEENPTATLARLTFVDWRLPQKQEDFIREIELELNEPTQQIRDIHGCRASEAELRKYLRLYCELLKCQTGAAPESERSNA